MKNNLQILKKSPLFNQITETDLEVMLHCLGATAKSFAKSNFIFSAGDPVNTVGIILSGSVHIVNEDFFGNRTIIATLTVSDLFGETFSCAQIKSIPVSVIAAEKSTILFIDYKRVISICTATCTFHSKLIQNMLTILAKKNLMLTQKINHITKRATRDKLLSYLAEQAHFHGTKQFTIPLNRQELADYLAVDRSAMSHELCKLRNEGILKFNRNQFELA